MKAVILAAGFSTRLYPLTRNFPKALLPLNGDTIISSVIDELISIEQVKDIAIITNLLYFPMFDVWIKNEYPQDKKIELLTNNTSSPRERLGAIGDLLFTLKKLKWRDDLIVLASDVVTSVTVKDMLVFYQKHQGVVNVLVDTGDRERIREKLGCASLENHRITEFVEKPKKPKTTLTSVPYYIFPVSTIPLIKKFMSQGRSGDSPGAIIPWLIDKISVFGLCPGRGHYFDVGTAELYNKVVELNKNK